MRIKYIRKMITVIADDFTGAAEIGGIGLRRGLKVIIDTKVNDIKGADLLVIATDTRSFSKEKASVEIKKLSRQINRLNPEYTFKKIDSVLRGNVVDELIAFMEEVKKTKAIVIAGNPYFKRIIKNGIYYINDVPLAETFFAQDPQYPIRSSNILDILVNGHDPSIIFSAKVDHELPAKGIVFGDVVDEEDMMKWTQRLDKNTVIAGGAGFFDSILKNDYPIVDIQSEPHYKLGDKSLFVFGSTYPKSDKLISQIKKMGMCIINMPHEIYVNKAYNANLIDQWANDIVTQIEKNKKVVVTINHNNSNDDNISFRVRDIIGLLIRKVVDKIELDDLLIEGGDTTSVILSHLGVTTLYPFQELGHGVIQLNVEKYPNMCITTKPGSYNWPDNIWISDTAISKVISE